MLICFVRIVPVADIVGSMIIDRTSPYIQCKLGTPEHSPTYIVLACHPIRDASLPQIIFS